MSDTDKFSFKNLLGRLPTDAPVDLAWLRTHHVRGNYAAQLARSGYLQKLGAGVYCLRGAKLERDASLVWLQAQVPHMHVASKTALAWRGVRHNVVFRDKLALWGETQFKVPCWFSEQFPVRHHTTHIFDGEMDPNFGISAAPGKPASIRVSVPERALLELFSEVGTLISSEEARNLTENARHLRRDVLAHLLAHTTRIKVVRLAQALSNELNLPWEDLARQHSERLGGSERWVLSHASSLETISLRKPT